MLNKTYQPNKATISRQWHLIDAKDQILGRLATRAAGLLTGKGKRVYSPHADCGDFVVVINATGIRITGGNKPVQKIDFRHSGYPGGDKMTPYGRFLEEKPDRAIQLAISGMLPKNKLRARMMTRLKIYKGATHQHGAQLMGKKIEGAQPTTEKQS